MRIPETCTPDPGAVADATFVQPCVALFIGTAGDLAVKDATGTTKIIPKAAGWIWLRASGLVAAGTTAQDVTAFF